MPQQEMMPFIQNLHHLPQVFHAPLFAMPIGAVATLKAHNLIKNRGASLAVALSAERSNFEVRRMSHMTIVCQP